MHKTGNKYFHSISRENNINAIRYYLAVCILMNHFCVLTGIDVVQLPRIFGGAGSFFAISGFLMFPSFEKNSDIKRYAKKRAKRILPPYILIVLASAILCSIISVLPPFEYFSSKGFWKYLIANLSFLNFLCPDLPGVFTSATNILNPVNGSLWTMKGEVACYMTVPIVMWLVRTGRIYMKRLLVSLMAVFGLLYLIFQYSLISGRISSDVAARQCLVMFLFFMGGYLNILLPIIKKYRRHIIIACFVVLAYEYINKYWAFYVLPGFMHAVVHYVLIPIVSGLMVIVSSVTGTWGRLLSRHNAFTYEIYLYHFPVIQVMIYFGMVDRLGFYSSLFLVFLIVSLMAWISCKFLNDRIAGLPFKVSARLSSALTR